MVAEKALYTDSWEQLNLVIKSDECSVSWAEEEMDRAVSRRESQMKGHRGGCRCWGLSDRLLLLRLSSLAPDSPLREPPAKDSGNIYPHLALFESLIYRVRDTCQHCLSPSGLSYSAKMLTRFGWNSPLV